MNRKLLLEFFKDNWLGTLVVAVVILGLVLLLVGTSHVEQKEVRAKKVTKVKIKTLNQQKDSLFKELKQEEKIVRSLKKKVALRTDSILKTRALDDSLQAEYEKSLHTPSALTARQLEQFFARYYDSAAAAQPGEILKK